MTIELLCTPIVKHIQARSLGREDDRILGQEVAVHLFNTQKDLDL